VRRRLRAAATVALALAAPLCGETVRLRGGEPPRTAPTVEFRPEGLRLLGGPVAETLAWDRVAAVEGRPLRPEETEWLAVAERLWRGRTRLARGDAALARVAFESVAPAFAGTDSESALIAAEGLLRCRLAAGDGAVALPAALETARLRAAGVRTDRFDALPPAIDAETWLVPTLVPAFPVDAAGGLVADELEAWTAARRGLDPTLAAIARGYAAILRGEVPSGPRPAAPAARLVHAAARLAAADRGDREGERAAARDELDAAVAAMPDPARDWASAWRAFLLGRSLAFGAEPARKREGVLLLLSIPARRTDPLARLALAEAARALRALGDAAGAARLERELLAGLPNGPLPSTAAP